IDDAAEDVAAQLVHPEGMGPAHAGERYAGPHLGIAIGRDEGADRGNGGMQEKDRPSDAEAERRLREEDPWTANRAADRVGGEWRWLGRRHVQPRRRRGLSRMAATSAARLAKI